MIKFKYVRLPTDEDDHDGYAEALSIILINMERCDKYRKELNSVLASMTSVDSSDVLMKAVDLATAEMVIANTKEEYEKILKHPHYEDILFHATIKAAGKP